MYLFGVLFAICIIFQRTTIHAMNTFFMGRLILFSSVIFVTLYDNLGGFIYGFILLGILNSAHLENFDNILPDKSTNIPVKVDTNIILFDREKEEKKLITPVFSNDITNTNTIINIPLNFVPNETGVINPSESSNTNYSLIDSSN